MKMKSMKPSWLGGFHEGVQKLRSLEVFCKIKQFVYFYVFVEDVMKFDKAKLKELHV